VNLNPTWCTCHGLTPEKHGVMTIYKCIGKWPTIMYLNVHINIVTMCSKAIKLLNNTVVDAELLEATNNKP
jgi:hypothetical protein